MGKKLKTKIKPTAPAKRKVKPVAKEKAAAPSAKATKAPAKPVKKTAKPKKPGYTSDDVALRAYFLAEKRNQAGRAGDPEQDWVEAERQLAAESKPAAKPKAKKK